MVEVSHLIVLCYNPQMLRCGKYKDVTECGVSLWVNKYINTAYM